MTGLPGGLRLCGCSTNKFHLAGVVTAIIMWRKCIMTVHNMWRLKMLPCCRRQLGGIVRGTLQVDFEVQNMLPLNRCCNWGLFGMDWSGTDINLKFSFSWLSEWFWKQNQPTSFVQSSNRKLQTCSVHVSFKMRLAKQGTCLAQTVFFANLTKKPITENVEQVLEKVYYNKT